MPIYYGTTEKILSKGVGNLENTSLPIGGIGNHSVLVAHSGLMKAKMFDNLDKLQLNDNFYINILDSKLKYKVNQIKVVKPEETDDLLKEYDKDYITLVTCTPKSINSHRLLVRGERIEQSYEEFEKENKLNNNIKVNNILHHFVFMYVIINKLKNYYFLKQIIKFFL